MLPLKYLPKASLLQMFEWKPAVIADINEHVMGLLWFAVRAEM